MNQIKTFLKSVPWKYNYYSKTLFIYLLLVAFHGTPSKLGNVFWQFICVPFKAINSFVAWIDKFEDNLTKLFIIILSLIHFEKCWKKNPIIMAKFFWYIFYTNN